MSDCSPVKEERELGLDRRGMFGIGCFVLVLAVCELTRREQRQVSFTLLSSGFLDSTRR